MNHELTQADEKKQYERPQLTTISLRPEEAVLGHCKTAGSTNFAGSNCGIIGLCRSFGS